MESIEKYLDSIGEKNSTQRLEVIATMSLGARSDAARCVYEKRYRRKELMDNGSQIKLSEATRRVNFRCCYVSVLKNSEAWQK